MMLRKVTILFTQKILCSILVGLNRNTTMMKLNILIRVLIIRIHARLDGLRRISVELFYLPIFITP